MPTFRIHNPKNRSDRVLIRLTRSAQGAFIPPPPSATAGLPPPPAEASVATSTGTSVSVKSKKKISLQQIQEVLRLLQKSKKKDILSLLSSNLADFEDEEVDIDDISPEEEVHVEEVPESEAEEEDVLVIEL